jgi:predicted DsbA family dithiol-disulfide isomerase
MPPYPAAALESAADTTVDVKARNSFLADVGAAAALDCARILAMLASDEGLAEVRSELQRAMNLHVSGVPTVLVDGIPLFSGAIRSDLIEDELRNAAGHVRS